MVLKLPQAQQQMFSIFQNDIFLVFCKFLSNKVGKVRQSMKNCVNQNMVIEIFLENGFKASLSSKTNVLSVYKMIFFRFFAIFR